MRPSASGLIATHEGHTVRTQQRQPHRADHVPVQVRFGYRQVVGVEVDADRAARARSMAART